MLSILPTCDAEINEKKPCSQNDSCDYCREQMNKKGTNYDSEAVRNLDIWSIELNASFRGGMRAWNRTVQFWLANYVYKRVPRSLGYC